MDPDALQVRRLLLESEEDEEFFDDDAYLSAEEDLLTELDEDIDSEQSGDEDDQGQPQPIPPQCIQAQAGPSTSATQGLKMSVFNSGLDGTRWFFEPQLRSINVVCNSDCIRESVTNTGKAGVSPIMSWSLFMTDEMLNKIITHTNKKLDEIRPNYQRERDARPVDMVELKAFIGILYVTGLHNSSHTNIQDLWRTDSTGVDFCRLVMSERRFRLLLCVLRFDNIDEEDRNRRLQTDRATKIREIFEDFVENCKLHYQPGEFVTVDETLEKIRGSSTFRVYMPQKPGRYGIKCYALADARTAYCCNIEIHISRQHDGPYKVSYAAKDIVLRLTGDLWNSGRTVTTDNFYTSYELAKELLARKLNLLGTLRRNKAIIPASFLQPKQLQPSPTKSPTTVFGFNEVATLVCYKPKLKKKKIVPVLSTMSKHNNNRVSDDDKKPIMIHDYNFSKGGVDVLDRLKNNYDISRSCRRWPLRIFFTVMNIAAINALIVYRLNTSDNMLRRNFLKKLARDLVYNHARRRAANANIHPDLRERIDAVFHKKNEEEDDAKQRPRRKENRCYLDSWRQYRKSETKCSVCEQSVCTSHRVVYCKEHGPS